jgi:hypothetical protein
MITMVFAGIRRQSRVEKGEFVMGVGVDFFDAKFRLHEVRVSVSLVLVQKLGSGADSFWS